MISFDGTPILLSGEVPRDADVLALLETFRPGLDALYGEVVGETKVTSKHQMQKFEFRSLIWMYKILKSKSHLLNIETNLNCPDSMIHFVS